MIKKIIAVVMSLVLALSISVTAFAEDEGGFNLDLGTILSSDIMQELMQNEGVVDLTNIILDIVVKYNAESLKAMGQEEAQKFIQSWVDTIGDSLKQIIGNADLIITYDPLKVMGNLFDLDTEALTETTTNPEDEPAHPDELVFGMGDVDGDGRVTAADARRIIRRAAKLIVFTMDEEARADVDKDGKITANDARKVLRVSAKLDTFETAVAETK